MATNIYNYDGTLRTTVADGALDSTTSIKFPGRGYLNYGEPVTEDLLWLMQHFAGATAPTNPIAGQVWYDTVNALLKVYTGTGWITSGGVGQAATAPGSGTSTGSFWYDTVNLQLQIWTGSAWQLVGPMGSATNGDPTITAAGTPSNTKLDIVRISDGSALHAVYRFTIGGTIVGFISKDAAFVPSPAITGFATIKPGLNFNSTIVNAGVNDTTTFRSTQSNLPAVTAAYDMGSPSYKFNNMYANNFNGVASSALYADLAERYKADEPLEAGTVVCLGGKEEIEACRVEGSDHVFGVVSTNPAYLMNAEAGDDATYPPVALAGRIPCKVVGPVLKGHRLMGSKIPGCAIAWTEDFGPLSVLGRSLVTKKTEGVETIEIVIGRL